MKIFVGILACLAASIEALPRADFFHARTVEEIMDATSKPSPKSKKELFRGRRTLQDGSMEVSKPVLADAFGGDAGFFHSVASGDPLPDAIILWTRYTPVNADDEITLEFRIAAVDATLEPFDAHLDPVNNPNLKRGSVKVTGASDFVAKIDVTGLSSNTQYVYVFTDGTVVSDVGLTKTAPTAADGVSKLTYAFFSCAHFTNGFFHAYDVASTIKDLDLWIHVGDYFYEYGLYSEYARDAKEARDPFILPVWEIVDLQDYRNRHASYNAHDEGLQNLRRRAPMIATWDDHETTNDSWGNLEQGAGAENHQQVCPANRSSSDSEKASASCDRDEGDAVARFTAAAQAYMEWMPIRHAPGSMGRIDIGTLTQTIEWGDLATM
jgi:alkaline phosphatase D